MPGQTYSAGTGYRYGINRMENNNDISVLDLDFGVRIYDSTLGRWLSTDPSPREYPGTSSYCYVLNSPLIAIDPDGKISLLPYMETIKISRQLL